jgi:serine/threonine protein kinase
MNETNDIHTGEAKSARQIPVKFMYSNGDQPLDGYTIKRGIGVGGFGEVYFAISDAGKEVALKKIQRNLDIELRGVRQCLNLKHINLIALWDIKTTDEGECWVVMEYVPGESLRDVINRYPSGMPLDEAHQWFVSAAAGVGYLHDKGIVHRDLKPGNIFCDDDEQVIKIGDYGLSKFISYSQRGAQTETVGTFHYMAPEIGRGVYGKEIDIYAMGVMLYEMVSGQLPFDGETTNEIIMKHLTADPDIDTLPEAYRLIVRRALAKDAERRYESIGAMLEDLPTLDDEGRPVPKRTGANSHVFRNSANVADNASDGSKIPPIQPMLISDEPMYIGDDASEMVMGDMVVGEVGRGVNAGGGVQHSNASNHVTNIALNDAHARPEEPIAAAVKSGWQSIVDWWFDANISTALKVVVLIAGGLLFMANVQWIVPLGLVLAIPYLIYYAVRVWTLPSKSKSRDMRQVSTTPGRRVISKRDMRAMVRQLIGQSHFTDRISELVGSLLFSAFACMVSVAVGLILSGKTLDGSIDMWSQFTWLSLTSVGAAWTVLFFGKAWETTEGEAMVRRFITLAAGLAIGAGSFAIAEMLQVPVNRTADTQVAFSLAEPLSSTLFNDASRLTMPGFMLMFGSLFAILRWWRQADPLRNTRFSIFSIGLCAAIAIVIGAVLEFPQVEACLIAVSAAVGIQLAAPWISRNRQNELVAIQRTA